MKKSKPEKAITVKLDWEMFRKIVQRAEKEGTSMSDIIRQAVDKKLKGEK